MFVRSFVRLLPAFLEIGSLVFSDFWHKDAKWQSPKCDGARFSEKIFFRPKMPELCRKSPFLQILFGLFPYISLFFHTKTLFITMPTINHSLIVNKTDFCSRNFLKIAGTADFHRKNGISWISRAVLYIFAWNFSHFGAQSKKLFKLLAHGLRCPRCWPDAIRNSLLNVLQAKSKYPTRQVIGYITHMHDFI